MWVYSHSLSAAGRGKGEPHSSHLSPWTRHYCRRVATVSGQRRKESVWCMEKCPSNWCQSRLVDLEMVEGAAGLNRPHMVHLLQLTSWPLQGLPHPTAILSLIEQLTSTQMKCGNRRTVIMCRYGEDVCVCGGQTGLVRCVCWCLQ